MRAAVSSGQPRAISLRALREFDPRVLGYQARRGRSRPRRAGLARQGAPGDTRKEPEVGREEAPEVAGPNEENADQAQATEEDVARQVVGSSAGSSSGLGSTRLYQSDHRLSLVP